MSFPIAYQMARKSRGGMCAHGGEMGNCEACDAEMMAEGGYTGPHGVKGATTSEDRSKMSGKSGLVRGTTQANINSKGVNRQDYGWGPSGGQSEAGKHVRGAEYSHPGKSWNVHGGYDAAKEEHRRVLGEMRSMPAPKLKAHGGMMDDDDIVARCMRKRMAKGGWMNWEPQKPTGVHSRSASSVAAENYGDKYSRGESSAGHDIRASKKPWVSDEDKKKLVEGAKSEHKKRLDELRSMPNPKLMSEGGMIANDDDIEAGFMPNQFDDLALRDDLESSYTGANSGDFEGSEDEDERRRDIVARIMRSRAKKDRNPRPA